MLTQKDREALQGDRLAAIEAEIKRRIEALKAAGYTQFTIQLVPGHEKAIEDWGRIAKAFA